MTDLAGQITAGMAKLTATQLVLMVDTCRVSRPTSNGQTPELDADGNAVAATDPTVYDGPCSVVDPKIPPRRGLGAGIVANDEAGSPEQRTLRVPHAAGLLTGDLVEITESPFSPGMVGDRFQVVREDERSYATYRAFILRGSSWQAPAG